MASLLASQSLCFVSGCSFLSRPFCRVIVDDFFRFWQCAFSDSSSASTGTGTNATSSRTCASPATNAAPTAALLPPWKCRRPPPPPPPPPPLRPRPTTERPWRQSILPRLCSSYRAGGRQTKTLSLGKFTSSTSRRGHRNLIFRNDERSQLPPAFSLPSLLLYVTVYNFYFNIFFSGEKQDKLWTMIIVVFT